MLNLTPPDFDGAQFWNVYTQFFHAKIFFVETFSRNWYTLRNLFLNFFCTYYRALWGYQTNSSYSFLEQKYFFLSTCKKVSTVKNKGGKIEHRQNHGVPNWALLISIKLKYYPINSKPARIIKIDQKRENSDI